jgi:hydroxymethylpyrimidine pyrophosphatase-like HAD family hydrolase
MITTKYLRVAFDVDGTLVSFKDVPIERNIELLKAFHKSGASITVWSGGGKDYADLWVRRLGLNEFVDSIEGKPILNKESEAYVDIAIDDEIVKFGHLNWQV